MASFGRLDEAEAAARSSIERFDEVGEVLLVVNSLNALAGIMAAKGDIEGASAAYEVLLRRCRASGEHPYLNSALVALAVLRARQGDDAAADDLYQEAIRCSFNPWLSADAIVGQAAVARRLGDLARAKRLLDTAAVRYRDADISSPASPECSPDWPGGRSGQVNPMPPPSSPRMPSAPLGQLRTPKPNFSPIPPWPPRKRSLIPPGTTSTTSSHSRSSEPKVRRIALSPTSQICSHSQLA